MLWLRFASLLQEATILTESCYKLAFATNESGGTVGASKLPSQVWPLGGALVEVLQHLDIPLILGSGAICNFILLPYGEKPNL